MTYWTNFAKTHRPQGAGLPYWQPYGTSRQRAYLEFGQEIRPQAGSRHQTLSSDCRHLAGVGLLIGRHPSRPPDSGRTYALPASARDTSQKITPHTRMPAR